MKIVFYPEDGGSELFWNVGNDLPDYTASYLKAIISKENTICNVSLNQTRAVIETEKSIVHW
jgi:hypothetical protein